jgi:DNA polymerase-3 subunit delta'
VRLGELIGQDPARDALRRAVARGRLAHAYLFDGPAGVGKRGAALGLAMALNCPEAPGDGCGACDVCRRIEAGLHPDVQTFGPSGAANQIVVDDAKAVLALARTRPHEGVARVIVLDDADALNPNAGNSLLKTLEEPLGGNHLVLCTSAPDKLLPTIRSRTQRIRFRPLTAAALLTLAAARGIPTARAEIAAALADGSAARLLAAAAEVEDDEADPARALAVLRKTVVTPGASGVFDFAAGIAGDKEGKQDLPGLLALLARLYRDALAAAAGAPELAVLSGAQGSDASPGATLAGLGTDRLSRALAAIVDAQTALTANVNPTLAIERLLMALKRQERRAA